MPDYIIEICPESGSFLGKATPSTEYANDFSETPGTGTSGDVPPSPTADLPKSHLKITVSDGPAPPSPGSVADAGSHEEGERPESVTAIRPSAPVAPTAPAAASSVGGGNPLQSPAPAPVNPAPVAPVSPGQASSPPVASAPAPAPSAPAGGLGKGDSGGQYLDQPQPQPGTDDDSGVKGNWGKPAQKGVVHQPAAAGNAAASLPAPPADAAPTAINHAAVAAPSVESMPPPETSTAASGVGVVEGIIEGPTPHIDAPHSGGRGKGRCPSKNGGQAKRSGQVKVEGGAKESDLGGNPGRDGPARHQKAKVSTCVKGR
jgi:hypothetical protein